MCHCIFYLPDMSFSSDMFPPACADGVGKETAGAHKAVPLQVKEIARKIKVNDREKFLAGLCYPNPFTNHKVDRNTNPPQVCAVPCSVEFSHSEISFSYTMTTSQTTVFGFRYS